jgi:hypothetical protein
VGGEGGKEAPRGVETHKVLSHVTGSELDELDGSFEALRVRAVPSHPRELKQDRDQGVGCNRDRSDHTISGDQHRTPVDDIPNLEPSIGSQLSKTARYDLSKG